MELYKQRKRKLSGRKAAQWFTVSVPSPEQESEEIPVLELKAFTKPTHINYDKVKVGGSKTCTLHVNNPLDVVQYVYLEKFPFDKNFSIDKKEYCVPASGTCTIDITWSPEKSVNCRETVLFKTSSGLRVQAYLHGTACSPKKQKRNNWKQAGVQTKQKNKEKIFSENNMPCDFVEGKKENINPPVEKLASSSLESSLFQTPQSKITLNPIDVFSDSPIRRQTYTINNMLRESQIGTKTNALPSFSLNQNKNEILKEKQVESSLNAINLPSQSRPKKTIISTIINTENDGKEILNDSLEVSPTDPSLDSTSSLVPCSMNSTNHNVTSSSVMDAVKVFDSSAKHFYFGYTPPVKNNNVVSSVPRDSVWFKCEEGDLKRKVNNPSTFVLNHMDAKSRTLSSTISPEKRLTFTATFANINTPTSVPNVIKGSPEINAVPQIDPVHYKSALPSNMKHLDDSLSEHALVTKQESKDSLHNLIEAIRSAECFPQPSCLPSSYNLGGGHQIRSSQLTAMVEESDAVTECHSSVAFEIKSEFPKPFKIPFDKQGLLTAKQKQPPKLKHKTVAQEKPGRKLVKELKLSCASFKSARRSPDVKLAVKINQTAQEPNVDTSTSDIHKKKSRLRSQRATLGKRKDLEMYQPNPYACFNAYYDEYWMEKQETAFTNWLNFILTPNDDFSSSEEVQVNCAEIWIESMKDATTVTAPSKEDLSFKAYTTAKQLRRLRETACRLYQSDKLAHVIEKVEREVDVKKLSIRKDRAIHADLGIKKDLLEMLLSYNPLWLRIGLETVYGEIISLQSNRDVVGLSRFIIHRFLSNPAIITKYSYSSIKNYYKPGYEDEIQRFTLKKFFLLVFFLDEAKRAHLIDHNPCLFCKSSKYKCSRDLLLTFSREYLSGEGDITKHLRYLGYVVEHEQKPIEEFDYAVRNIAVDLRCGIRLGRVVELLLQDWEISKTLRVNTLNRLAKIHNNDVILKALEKVSINVEGKIDPRDVVDGNKEKTLSLLWQIIFKTQIAKNVNLEDLKKENSHLRRSLKLNADFAAFEALQNGYGEAKESDEGFFNSKLYKENEVIQQLLQWCQNVAAHYGVKVYNFTSSFADGRVLCLLMHHYHPNLLPLDKIKMETSSSYFLKQMEASEDENNVFSPSSLELTSGLKEKLLKNDKENLDLVFQKFQEIGHIPILSFPLHVPNTLPDEKVTITLVSYINIRLMELSVVIRAARTILLAYRKWCLRKKQQKLKVQIAAVCTIQRYWHKYVTRKRKQKEEQAATVIQQCWKRFSALKLLKQLKQEQEMKSFNQNATVIQAAYRGYLTRKHLQKCKMASIVLQKNIRMWLVRSRYLRLKRTVVKIQRTYRSNVLGRSQRLEYLQTKNMVIRCQAIIRGHLVRNQMKRQSSAAVVIQSQFRGHIQRSKFRREKAACLIIQSHLRRFICRKLFLKQKNAVEVLQNHFRAILIGRKVRESYLKDLKLVTTIQALVRGWLVRKHMCEFNCSATKIQAAYRSFVCRKMYLLKKQSVIILQRQIKLYLQNKANERRKFNAAVVIQSCFRSYIAQRKFMKIRTTCISIQANFRRYVLHKRFLKQKSAAILLQKRFRAYLMGKNAKESYIKDRKSVIAVQALVRGWLVRKHMRKLNLSATKLQASYRSYICQKNYLKKKRSAIILQRCIRSYLCKKSTERRNIAAAIVIQSTFRGYMERLRFRRQKSACVVIQSYLRKHICRNQFLKKKRAVMIIQNHYKAFRIGTKVRNCFLKDRKNIITAQAVTKGWLVRKHMIKLHKSAISIQSAYRAYVCHKNYQSKKQSAIILQRCVRSYLYKKATERKNFAAAVLIQSTFRGYMERLRFRRQKSACIVIQSYLRKHICRKQYLKRKKAARVIQSQYRAFRIGTKIRNGYIKDRAHIIMTQAIVRGWLTRSHIHKLKKSATTIQATFRSRICRNSYLKKKKSAIIIQRVVRSYLCKKATERRNCAAAVVIQSNFRGYIERLRFKRQKTACIVIQSHLKRYICRNRYLILKKAVTSIQNRYRAFKIGTNVRKCYIKDLEHIITVQAIANGWLTRRRIHKLNKSATTIQSTFRSYICRKNYLKKKQSAIILQRCVRSYLNKKATERRNFAAAVIIQSHFRGFIEIQKFKRQKFASIVIQSHLRKHICMKEYLTQKKAAVIIQNHYRAFRIGSKVRNCFLEDRKNIIIAQAVTKGWLVRKHVDKLHRSATTIQSAYRSYACHKSYQRKKQSAIILQRCVRSYLCKKATEKRNFTAAVVIQSTFRGYIERSRLRRQKSACIVIQSYLRKHICRKQYLKQKKAAITIQSQYRAFKVGTKIRNGYIKEREHIITTQAIIRGWLIRKHIHKLNGSATTIQTAFRSYICCKSYLKQKQSAIIVQRCIRSYLCKKVIERRKYAAVVIQSSYRSYVERLKFKRQKSACIVIQSYLRRLIHRNRFLTRKKAAVAIQSHFRATLLGRDTRNSYLNDRKSVVAVQAVVRGWLTRRNFNKLNRSATKIQTAYRSYICKKKILKQKHSAIILQRCIKSYFCRKAIERKRDVAVTVIQASFRGYIKRSAFKKEKAACIVIQSSFRRHVCHKKFLKQKLAANVIQKHFKALLIGRIVRKTYLHDRKCIIAVQSVVRSWIVKRHIQQQQYSATKIQTIYRAYICRKQYLKKRQSIITIQKHFKSYMCSKRIHSQYITIRQSTIRIQSAWRTYKAKCELSRRNNAAILLQSHIRKLLAQKQFLTLRQSAIVIQRYYLAYKAGLREYRLYKEKVRSCIKIQACVRGYIVRKGIEKQIDAAIVIQQNFRRWTERKALSEALKMDPQYLWYSRLRGSIVTFQRRARSVLQKRANLAVIIQSYFRMWLVKKRYKRERAALKIQALWRGYSVRRSINNEKLDTIRKNINKVYDRHQLLAHRTTRALEALQSSNLRNILYALQNLDVCTRLSPTCCERLKESGGLSKLILLIDSCNRSVPHRDIIKLCTNILLNLAKYKKTVDAVWREPDALNILLKLMNIFYKDKTVPIFSKCCSLFWIFNQDPKKAQLLKGNSVFTEQIQKFNSLLTRKKKLEAERCTKNTNASWNCSIAENFLNSRESLVIDPDWILGQHRRREFKDPFVAIASLMHSLDLE